MILLILHEIQTIAPVRGQNVTSKFLYYFEKEISRRINLKMWKSLVIFISLFSLFLYYS